MSGGVDSSVAAARLVAAGHDVVGVTLRLWGGPSDSGCCSVADVEDARWVADRLGIVHRVLDFEEAFTRAVVEPYVQAHAEGRTPNPCVDCNRVVKFGHLLAQADRLGFDRLATGHHARLRPDGRLTRGRDRAKDQSYVLAELDAVTLGRLVLPIGELTKAEVRREAAALGLPTATKPESMETCFIGRREGRRGFLDSRLSLRPATVIEAGTGRRLGTVPAVELVTVGQRRGLGALDADRSTASRRRYVVDVDCDRRVVTVGDEAALLTDEIWLEAVRTPTGRALVPGARLLAQTSAHGTPRPVVVDAVAPPEVVLHLAEPGRRVAPGQLVALYDEEEVVVGSGRVATPRREDQSIWRTPGGDGRSGA